MTIFITLLIYILPIILSVLFMAIAYKIYHIESTTFEHIYNYYYNSDTFTEKEPFKDTSYFLTTFLFVPVLNIFLMFYFLVLIIYNSIRTIEIQNFAGVAQRTMAPVFQTGVSKGLPRWFESSHPLKILNKYGKYTYNCRLPKGFL